MNTKSITASDTDTAILLCEPAVIAVDIDAPQPMSREEVEDLKRKWTEDPCWNLKYTVGFEDHRDELGAYSAQMIAEWEAGHKARELREREAIAVKIGVPADHVAVRYVLTLERRLERIEERLAEVEHRFDWGRK